MSPNAWTDLLTLWLDFTEADPSPEIFRKWAGLGMIGAGLERRVWLKAGKKTTYPNLYVWLVGPPGTGKGIINQARQVLGKIRKDGSETVGALHLSPDSVSRASLMDDLNKAKTIFLPPSGAPYTYHSLSVCIEEFGVFMPEYDSQFVHSLNDIFNNKETAHEESRRTGTVRELRIEKAQFNILGGVQPSYLAHTIPEHAWQSGIARRLIMVYAAEPPKQELFYEPELPDGIEETLLTEFTHLTRLYGQFQWTREAAEMLAKWDRDDGPPQPTHSKLAHYNRSRTMHALKLTMISAVSRTCKLVLEGQDVERALGWLIEAEALMPDIFREMIGKSDAQVVEELHQFMMNEYRAKRRKPLPGKALWNFLHIRVPSEKIQRIVDTMERANIIARVAGTEDLWIPRPKDQHGME